MNCLTIGALLDSELHLERFSDVSNNGLQLENRGEIDCIVTAVDASLETFEAAVAQGAQMVIVHHGLSWGNSLARITEVNYTLLSYAMKHNLAVYAAHLPLDAHPVLGNNAQLAKLLGLNDLHPFMAYHGQKIGFSGTLSEPLSREAFEARIREAIKPVRMEVFPYGGALITTVGICSGGAPEGIAEAARDGLDAYVCGEANLMAYHLARHCRQNGYFAGHYVTERYGVLALADWLQSQTQCPVHFIDFNLPY
ncbi:MAG: Nif3-like dinuclear metal center hexameric protein [Kiritimatiellia bacterium]